MSALTALVATGAVLVSITLRVSAPRLWTLFATSATKALNLLNVAISQLHLCGRIRHEVFAPPRHTRPPLSPSTERSQGVAAFRPKQFANTKSVRPFGNRRP